MNSACTALNDSNAFVVNDTAMPCYFHDRKRLLHGWDHIDADGVTRKCSNGEMRLPTCELSILKS